MEGKKIRELRMKNGDSLRELGEKLGYSFSSLGKMERGELRPDLDMLKKIAKVYDVPVSFFLETEIPPELKEIGVEWISFAEEMKEKQLTPEELRHAADMILNLRKKSE